MDATLPATAARTVGEFRPDNTPGLHILHSACPTQLSPWDIGEMGYKDVNHTALKTSNPVNLYLLSANSESLVIHFF
jgi:hypothetical protein